MVVDLVAKVREKRELRDISVELVEEVLAKYLKGHNISGELKKSEVRVVVKGVRAKLRLYSGRFQKSVKDRSSAAAEGDIDALLRSHTSTCERLDFYPVLIENIDAIDPDSILDLGCGLNPLALAEKRVEYFAGDIKESEIKIIADFFVKNKIKGSAFIYDLRHPERELPVADLGILFKVLDIIEVKSHKLAREVLIKIPVKKALVSFATRTLSGKPMSHPRRLWFERLCDALEYPFEFFSSDNEIFYLVHKSSK